MLERNGFVYTSLLSYIKKAILYTCIFLLASTAWCRSVVSSVAVENSHILKNSAGTL